jgi:hypothetical protein
MRVKNFSGFMKTRKINESMGEQDWNLGMDGQYGANPEDEENPEGDEMEGDDADGEEAEELTIDDLKAMIEDLDARLKKLEPEEEESEEGEEAEGEEAEPAEGEEEAK